MRNSTAGTSSARALALALACVLLAASAARAQEAAAGRTGGVRRPAATGLIRGRVVGEGGEPMPNVSVFVARRGANLPGRQSSITTDDEGNFTAPGLDRGVYFVVAVAPGYIADPEQLSREGGHRIGDFVHLRLIRGGVVTGTVTNAAGEPLPLLAVRASRLRERDGSPLHLYSNHIGEDYTDDRGVYRVYGLAPGSYVVAAGGGQSYGWGMVSPYDGYAQTFHPSATRDTAVEVQVRSGQETAGVDIRYREERGRRVTGTLVMPATAATEGGASVSLLHAGSGVLTSFTWVSLSSPDRTFTLDGLGDGEYELQAQLQTREGEGASSAAQRVTVRGADVTGLRLTLAPLASVSGTLAAEPAPEALRALEACKGRAAEALPQETLVAVRRDAPRAAEERFMRLRQPREAAPDPDGSFTLRNLEAGAYRFEARPLDENFYVRALELPATAGPAAAGARPAAAAPPEFVSLNGGQQLKGVSIRLAAGAAAVEGRVVAAGAQPPPFSSLRVYLLPAERERAGDLLRHRETAPAADGSFAFRHLAPGRYLLLARAVEAPADAPPRPLLWDADARARLRREAESAGPPLELQPCQRVADFSLRYPPAAGK